MKLNDRYIKATLAGIPYLLPYGQLIADPAPATRLNDSGSLLWDGILEGDSREELLALLADRYHATERERAALAEDVDQYLHSLCRMGILLADTPEIRGDDTPPLFYRIGPLVFSLPWSLSPIRPLLLRFFLRRGRLRPGGSYSDRETGFHSLRRRAYSHGGTYHLRQRKFVLFLFCSAVGHPRNACKKTAHAPSFTACRIRMICTSKTCFTRFASLFSSRPSRRSFMCCTPPLFLYRGRAFLVSGSSGTGKSTHSALWHDLYQTPLLNGDLNLLGIRNNIPYAYGLPWCGTSGICTPKDYLLGGIIFLKQAAIDQVQSLQPDEKVLHILQRMISPRGQRSFSFAICIFPKPSLRSSFPVGCTARKSLPLPGP